MKIIPAIDIVDGKCVRLTQGDFRQKVIYSEEPLLVAMEFERIGFRNLHLVDLDGAKNGEVTNWKTIEQIAGKTQLEIDFGGGVKTSNEIERLLGLGVSRVNIGSIAVTKPKMVVGWLDFFGPEKLILSADFKDGNISVNGWMKSTSISVLKLLTEYATYGIESVTCTDISRDGMLSGPNFSFYKNLMKMFPGIRLTASGGISSFHDLKELEMIGVHGAIVGKAIYEGRIKLTELINEFLC